MKALIEGARVAQIVEDGEEFPVAPPLRWVDAPTSITTRHEFDGTKFVEPPAPPLPEDTRTTPDDVVRALISKGVLTATDITDSKKNR